MVLTAQAMHPGVCQVVLQRGSQAQYRFELIRPASDHRGDVRNRRRLGSVYRLVGGWLAREEVLYSGLGTACLYPERKASARVRCLDIMVKVIADPGQWGQYQEVVNLLSLPV